jgi:hypothetical protein
LWLRMLLEFPPTFLLLLCDFHSHERILWGEKSDDLTNWGKKFKVFSLFGSLNGRSWCLLGFIHFVGALKTLLSLSAGLIELSNWSKSIQKQRKFQIFQLYFRNCTGVVSRWRYLCGGFGEILGNFWWNGVGRFVGSQRTCW